MTNNHTGDLPVVYERIHDHIAVITLNRPVTRNAINARMAELIEDAVAQAESDTMIRVGIVAASGASFCAGADLGEIAAGRAAALSRPQTGFAGFVFGKRAKPWIAAVQGAAHGGGTEIALACDMIVAGSQATFGLTEVRRGLIAGAGGCIRLAAAIPRAIAIEMVVAGIPINASRAYELGLVNRIVDTAEVRDEAIRLADAIAANSPLSVRQSLKLARAASELVQPELFKIQDKAIAKVVGGPDMIEGATAFVEKRPPHWRS
jgi:enoyl-CoA hydratase/carnithine racemase